MMHLDASSPFDHSINCCSIKNQLHLMCILLDGDAEAEDVWGVEGQELLSHHRALRLSS